MPKMKTHKATVKRIKVTGTGKLMHKKCGGAHLKSKMSSKQKRRVRRMVELAKVDCPRIKKLIRPGGQL